MIATWAYDGAGNRTREERQQGGVQTLTLYTYDAASQIVTFQAGAATTTFTFDASGNVRTEDAPGGRGRTTFTWDPQDRLPQGEPLEFLTQLRRDRPPFAGLPVVGVGHHPDLDRVDRLRADRVRGPQRGRAGRNRAR